MLGFRGWVLRASNHVVKVELCAGLGRFLGHRLGLLEQVRETSEAHLRVT